MTRFYTGVGSRRTPPGTLEAMSWLATVLRARGYRLRSGGAEGADTAFEQGAVPCASIYAPWPGFRGYRTPALARPTMDAYQLAATAHPAWDRLDQGPRALHARNCHQVLGADLKTPSDFLVCWTPDGCTGVASRTKDTGGTATAIVIAERFGVPVFNLRDERALQRVLDRSAGQA